MLKLKYKSRFITLVMLVAAALLVVLPSSALANGAYSGGSGTEGDPYQISTASDWTDLRSTSADWEQVFHPDGGY